jgi:SAM-dependent methyltransferase
MKGKKVTAIGMNFDWYGDLTKSHYANIEVMSDVDVCEMKVIEAESIEAIWCAHTLEHVRNVGKALDEMFRVLKPEGLLFLTVPPFGHAVVGGHISVGWNIGILMYNLIISGFDVKNGEFINHKSNISAFVRKKEHLPFKVCLDTTDMETLKEYYPSSIRYVGTVAEKNIYFNGDLNAVNWRGEIPKNEETQIVPNLKRSFLKRALKEITPPILISRIYHPLKRLKRTQ